MVHKVGGGHLGGTKVPSQQKKKKEKKKGNNAFREVEKKKVHKIHYTTKIHKYM